MPCNCNPRSECCGRLAGGPSSLSRLHRHRARQALGTHEIRRVGRWPVLYPRVPGTGAKVAGRPIVYLEGEPDESPHERAEALAAVLAAYGCAPRWPAFRRWGSSPWHAIAFAGVPGPAAPEAPRDEVPAPAMADADPA